ncbi:metallophosphoesterase [Paenibacillus sp. CC-CFT747]|nr:metallophosphoesterase [Paenibacillus sp. CC-CFT747]
MTRREFIKWLAGASVLLGGGWLWLGQKPGTPGPAAEEALAEAAPGETAPAPSPSPSPVPQGPGELLASFFLFSDMHISAGEASMSDKLKLALDDVTGFESPVEAIVFGGDLTDFGRDSDYRVLRSILDRYKLPKLYGNMGNHDYYDIWLTKDGQFSTETMPNGKTDAMARQRFQKFLGMDKAYGDAWVNGVHLILVSQEAYVQERSDVGEGAWYSDEQLEWLRRTMEEHKDGKPALVFIHQPFPAVGSDGRTHQLIRANEFRAILKPYKNVFVFSGHTHRSFNGENHYNRHENLHWFNNASVGRTRSAAPNSNVSQGMYIQVYENEIAVRGREFSTREWIDGAGWQVKFEV